MNYSQNSGFWPFFSQKSDIFSQTDTLMLTLISWHNLVFVSFVSWACSACESSTLRKELISLFLQKILTRIKTTTKPLCFPKGAVRKTVKVDVKEHTDSLGISLYFIIQISLWKTLLATFLLTGERWEMFEFWCFSVELISE